MATQGINAGQDVDQVEALRQAAIAGDEETVAQLLSNGAQANSKDDAGQTPLMHATGRGHLCVVQKLLQSLGAEETEERDDEGRTALHYAADRGREEVASVLLRLGAQANSKDGNAMTPLMQASLAGYLSVVQQLYEVVGEQGLGEQDVEGMAAIHHAAGGGYTDVMAFLLTRGAQASSTDSRGITPLMHASCQGHLGAVKLLFGIVGDKGLEEQDEDGWTALLYAVDGDHDEVVKFLLSNGAQASSKDRQGQTPLMRASHQGYLGVVEQLIQVVGKQGLGEQDENGLTALHYAASGDHEEVALVLLSSGAQASAKDKRGVAPLMQASSQGHVGVVENLLQIVGSQALEERDDKGRTALLYAADRGREEVASVLLRLGAQANSKDGKGMTPLMQASLQGYLSVVQQLYEVVGEQGLEEQDEDGWTALYHAAGGGYTDVMAFLLTHGAQASSTDSRGITPLMHASGQGQQGAVKLLFGIVGDKGLTETDKNGWTALLYAANEGHEEVVKLLLSNGAQASSKDRKGQTPLMRASLQGYVGVAEQLVQVVGEEGLVDRDENGLTALHYAASGGQTEVVAVLSSRGAQANSKDGTDWNPLMHACAKGHVDVTKTLVEYMAGQGLEDRDKDGWTALHHAAGGDFEEVVALLLSAGVHVNSKDGKGVTPLMLVSREGRLAAAQKLLQVMGGKGLEERDEDGWTALHHAAEGGHEELATLLLRHGAQANSKDGGDLTPLMLAATEGHLGVVERLHQVVGAQGLEEPDVDGWTALHYAADRGHAEIAATLLMFGAHANTKGSDGMTPLMLACDNGDVGVLRVLLRHTGGQGLQERDAEGRTALHLACWYDSCATDLVRALLLAGADPTSSANDGATPRTLAEMKTHNELVALFEWWEAELERPYLLHRAKCLTDMYMKYQPAVTDPMPAYLKARALPRVEVVAAQQEQHGGISDTEASAEARGAQEGDEELHATLTYSLKEMNEQLYIELLEGFHGPRGE